MYFVCLGLCGVCGGFVYIVFVFCIVWGFVGLQQGIVVATSELMFLYFLRLFLMPGRQAGPFLGFWAGLVGVVRCSSKDGGRGACRQETGPLPTQQA